MSKVSNVSIDCIIKNALLKITRRLEKKLNNVPQFSHLSVIQELWSSLPSCLCKDCSKFPNELAIYS